MNKVNHLFFMLGQIMGLSTDEEVKKYFRDTGLEVTNLEELSKISMDIYSDSKKEQWYSEEPAKEDDLGRY